MHPFAKRDHTQVLASFRANCTAEEVTFNTSLIFHIKCENGTNIKDNTEFNTRLHNPSSLWAERITEEEKGTAGS